MANITRQNNVTTIIQIIVLVLLCGGIVGLAAAFGVFNPSKEYHTVTLRIESSVGSAQVIYTLPTDSSKEAIQTSTPWEKSSIIKTGSDVYVSAANPFSDGQVACIILVDSKVWKKNTAKYPETKVSCAGIIP